MRMRRRRIHALAASCAALFIVLGVHAATASTLLQKLSLEEVTVQADRIVHGTVTDVRSGRDDRGLPATWITLDVQRRLKGSGASQITFKQFGTARPLGDGTITQVAGAPRFAVGENVVVFLHADSSRGFTSPVGLAQGVYYFDPTNAGRAARSGRAAGPSVDEFLAEVTRLLERHK